MGRGSFWKPGSARERGPRATQHNTRYESYKPDYSQEPPATHLNTNIRTDSRTPDHSRGSRPRDGPHRVHHRDLKSNTRAIRGSSKHAINPLKSKIFDLNRLLKLDLTANVRVEKERELISYERDLEVALQEKKKSEVIGKYHMVRFVERQKATRNIKKNKKALGDCLPGSPEFQKLQEALHFAEVDLAYTQYSPLYQKYAAIYPGKESKENMEVGKNGQPPPRPAMWKVVEKCMKDGTLDALRDGTLEDEDLVLAFKKMKPFKSTQTFTHTMPMRFKASINNNNYNPLAAGQADKMDEDSDGGFFEEDGGVKLDPP